jgi:formamidopyrimidine-DNA glycosylase
MPELPDVTVYIEALARRFEGATIRGVRVPKPFVVRSYDPPIRAVVDRTILGFRRIGKRIVFELDDDMFVIIHLMVAGRFRLLAAGAKLPGKLGLLALDFDDASLVLTEASKKKRASLHVVRGEAALAEHDPGGIEVLDCTLPAFHDALVRENHTLKRTLTDPRVFSGIGNAYSDEVLHRARLSPLKWTTRLDDREVARLHQATQQVLREWTERLREQAGAAFPAKVTAFRPEMAVHGRFKQPCPVCETAVQRIVRGSSEVNYCPRCQTGGKLLADRALSRLLKGDWPKTLEELDELKTRQRG